MLRGSRLKGWLTLAATTAAAVWIIACGASSSSDLGGGFASTGARPGTEDAGVNGSSGSGSSSGEDSGNAELFGDAAPQEADAAPLPTTVTFVHASPGLFDKRLCWSVGGKVTTSPPFPSGTPMPASNYPGIPAGGEAMLADATELTRGAITFVAIDANILAEYERADQVRPCVDRLQPNGTWAVPLAAVQTLPLVPAVRTGSAAVLALEGCIPGVAGASAAACGSGWEPASGNLHVQQIDVAQLSTAAAGVLKVQAALLSPGLAALEGDAGAGSVQVQFGALGDALGFASLASEGDIQPTTPTLLDLGTSPGAFGELGFGVYLPNGPGSADAGPAGGEAGAETIADAAEGGNGAGTDAGLSGSAAPALWMSLAAAQSLVDPGMDPRAYFGASATYVAAVLGDPAAPAFGSTSGAAYDGRGLHLLVFRSRPQ